MKVVEPMTDVLEAKSPWRNEMGVEVALVFWAKFWVGVNGKAKMVADVR